MKLKTWLPLVLAVVLGLAAMKVARDMTSKKDPGKERGPGTTVVVLRSDVSAGAALTAADLATVEMTGEINREAMFTDPAELDGRVLVADAVKGTPVASAMLAPKGSGAGLQALIPDGMRAITVEINEFSGVAGFLAPGCRVDVVVTIGGDAGEMLSRTVVQNVKVQAMGTRQQADPNAPVRSVTLLVTPKEAEAIELACATGRPRLVLRPGSDGSTEESIGVTVAELRTGNPASLDPFSIQPVQYLTPASQPTQSTQVPSVTPVAESRPDPRPRVWQRKVQVIRGGVESTITFDEVATPSNPRWITGTGTDELPGTGQ
jgi:pilus assembly protein CpaB